MVNFVDIIFGLSWGDEGKGKISNAISKKYDMVCRWNGGPNAGHTVYLNDKKYKTNQQQDSFDFVAAILQSCETLFSLFTYQVIFQF